MTLSSPPAATSTTTTVSSTSTTTRNRRHSSNSSNSNSSNNTAPRSRHRAATATTNTTVDTATQHLVSQLEQISLTLAITIRHDDDVRYVLTVRHARARALWKHPRSFDEYIGFQTRLLQALHHGHACIGACPWLETFVVNYFPAKTHFWLGNTTRLLLDRRNDALTLVLQTIRSFLLKREHLACAVARTYVAPEFLAFVYGELLDEHRVLGTTTPLQLPSGAVFDPHGAGIEHAASSIGGNSNSRDGDDDATSRSAADAKAPVEAVGPVTVTPLGDLCRLCGLAMPTKNIYVTQLRCGHRFHDECALPKLNEALRCPTCGTHDV